MKIILTLCVLMLLQTSYATTRDRLESHSNCNHNTWGFYGHKRINRMAVFTLPGELFTFYKKNIEFITEHAVDPDKRRYAAKGEAQRHYIDIDYYAHNGQDPFEVMPKKWKDAVEKYSEDTLQAYGIIPWHLEVMMYRLTKAFKEQNLDRILSLSADLGHYIGDAHVPLHTTENYNGQLTNQKGIHGFWESRVPELSAEDYDYLVGSSVYVSDPLEEAWRIVKESHYAVDSVLRIEKELTEEFGEDKKYTMEERGRVLMKVQSEAFAMEYQKRLDDMQEKRMRASILMVGSFWYTAWVNAGQPNLDKLSIEISDELKKELEESDQFFKDGKIIGREHGQ